MLEWLNRKVVCLLAGVYFQAFSVFFQLHVKKMYKKLSTFIYGHGEYIFTTKCYILSRVISYW